MSKISGKETKPEILVRKHLFLYGFRFRKNDLKLPGKPDIVLPKYKTAIFIHGCFWHHHKGCKKSTFPTTNAGFWQEKISKNVARDKLVKRQLNDLGWKVITIWQCQLSSQVRRESTLKRLSNKLLSLG